MWLLVEVLVVFAIVGAVMFSAFGAKTFVLAALAVIMLLAWIAVYMHGWTVKHTEFESPTAGYTASPEFHRVASESVSANNYAVLLAMGILISLIGLICILVAPRLGLEPALLRSAVSSLHLQGINEDITRPPPGMAAAVPFSRREAAR